MGQHNRTLDHKSPHLRQQAYKPAPATHPHPESRSGRGNESAGPPGKSSAWVFYLIFLVLGALWWGAQ